MDGSLCPMSTRSHTSVSVAQLPRLPLVEALFRCYSITKQQRRSAFPPAPVQHFSRCHKVRTKASFSHRVVNRFLRPVDRTGPQRPKRAHQRQLPEDRNSAHTARSQSGPFLCSGGPVYHPT